MDEPTNLLEVHTEPSFQQLSVLVEQLEEEVV